MRVYARDQTFVCEFVRVHSNVGVSCARAHFKLLSVCPTCPAGIVVPLGTNEKLAMAAPFSTYSHDKRSR